jgi:hypothetical protein
VSANNNAAGGHLNQHIYCAIPPSGASQVGKTLFTSVEEYTGVAVQCSGNHARQSVTVYSVLKKDKIGGYSCTAADATGKCTAQTRSQFSSVQLDFEVVRGNWVLLTASPVN